MILIIKHGGPAKIPAVRAARRLAKILVVDSDEGVSLDGVRFLPLPAMNVEFIVAAATRLNPVACLTYVDPVATLAAEVGERLSLPSLSSQTAASLKDKARFRDKLKASGVRSPRYHAVESANDLAKAAGMVGFPCVLKPAAGAYGLGVRRIDSFADLHPEFAHATAELVSGAFARFFAHSGPVRWLLEEYLPGPELSIEVLGHPLSPTILAIHEKTVTEYGGHFREDRFVTAPWKLSESQLRNVTAQAQRICAALGFSRGVGNLEARLIEGDLLAPIELQTCPAGGLVSAMVRRSCGIDLHELHARCHLQWEPIEPGPVDPSHACAMEILRSRQPGHFRITGIEDARDCDGIFDLQVLAEEGTILDPHSEYLGFVCAEGKHPATAVDRLEKALQSIRVEHGCAQG